MKKVLILHGWEWHSNENWFPYVRENLDKSKFEVIIPDLPTTMSPEIDKQLKSIKNIELNEWDYIIGHSLWGKLALSYIKEKKIKKLNIIYVAPTYPSLFDELNLDIDKGVLKNLDLYCKSEIDFDTINSLDWNHMLFLSDNDPYINIQSAKDYYWKIDNLDIREFHNMWHFNKWHWLTELPEILEYIK